MKIALKSNLWLNPVAEVFDFFAFGGGQLFALILTVFLTAVFKVYLSYWNQQMFLSIEQIKTEGAKLNVYHNALVLEQSTLLTRARTVAVGKRHFNMIVPKKLYLLPYMT